MRWVPSARLILKVRPHVQKYLGECGSLGRGYRDRPGNGFLCGYLFYCSSLVKRWWSMRWVEWWVVGKRWAANFWKCIVKANISWGVRDEYILLWEAKLCGGRQTLRNVYWVINISIHNSIVQRLTSGAPLLGPQRIGIQIGGSGHHKPSGKNTMSNKEIAYWG